MPVTLVIVVVFVADVQVRDVEVVLVEVVVMDVVDVSVVDVVVLVAPTSTIITTVGVVVTTTVIPEREGIKLISRVIKALISDKESCEREAVLFCAASSASSSPMDAGKRMI